MLAIESFYEAAQRSGLLTAVTVSICKTSETLQSTAQRSGLLTAVTVGTATVHCAFRAPDETVLDGFALSRDYQIDYPAVWLTLAAGDTVEIAGSSYQVRDVRAIGDGTERRASLSQL